MLGRSFRTALAIAATCTALRTHAATITSTWLGGTGAWEDPTQWSAGVPQNTTTDSFDALIDGGNPTSSTVTLGSQATVGSLIVDSGDSVSVGPSGQLQVQEGINNSGTIRVEGSVVGPSSTGNPHPPATLFGGGQVVLSGGNLSGGPSSIGLYDSLTNLDNRISGWGSLGYQAGFINYGVVEANVPGASLGLGSQFKNFGSLIASNGSTLGFGGGPFEPIITGTVTAIGGSTIFGSGVSGATLTALENSTIYINNQLIGDHFVTDASSRIFLQGSESAEGSDVRGGEFDGNLSVRGTLSGTVINRGPLSWLLEGHTPSALDLVNYGQISVPIEVYTDVPITLEGGGDLTLGTASSDPNLPPRLIAAPLTNVDNHIAGFGRINGLVQNGGSIEAANGVLSISGSFVHTGVLGASGGGTLEMPASVGGTGSWLADGGQIHVTGDVETTGDAQVVHGGILAVDGTMSTASLVVDNTGSLDVNGLLKVAGNLSFHGANNGRWLFGPSSIVTMTRGGGAPVGHWGGWQRIEAAGLDLGSVAAGFTNGNFYFPELVIGPDGRLVLRDQFDNGNRTPTGPEAVYVDTLVFSDPLGLLDLNGIHLYYNHIVGSAAQIIDTAVPEPSALWLVGLSVLSVLVGRSRTA